MLVVYQKKTFWLAMLNFFKLWGFIKEFHYLVSWQDFMFASRLSDDDHEDHDEILNAAGKLPRFQRTTKRSPQRERPRRSAAKGEDQPGEKVELSRYSRVAFGRAQMQKKLISK